MNIDRIIARIRELMDRRGMQITTLADRAGIARPAVSRLLGGKIKNPTLDTLDNIAKALEVPTRELFPAESTEIKGYIEMDEKVIVVKSRADLERIIEEQQE